KAQVAELSPRLSKATLMEGHLSWITRTVMHARPTVHDVLPGQARGASLEAAACQDREVGIMCSPGPGAGQPAIVAWRAFQNRVLYRGVAVGRVDGDQLRTAPVERR